MPTLSRPAVLALTTLTMVAFAANSVLARLALATTETGAASFTAIRLGAGAFALALLARQRLRGTGSWASGAALFVYAAAFSYAYLSLSTGTGALLLFGAVQITMIGWGLARGERFGVVQTVGLILAMGGLVVLLAPGVTAPPLGAALLMAASGAAWGVYSLRGRGAGDPIALTAGNFWRAALMGGALLAVAWLWPLHVWPHGGVFVDARGAGLALASGGLTSGLGYALWYRVLPSLRASSAATVQLSVPVIAALGGLALVGEALTLRLALASVVTLGGIALVVRGR
ncbi:DMT family transporter [Rubricoccus marinus]|uniref:EamA family transporter n=1 Tax=Rubricoccus marinus TaxID=716817 RepID=A0A259U1X0_9BACT|nr:DMT family transporter [Rubricoccus marinus]OZC03999.1 EamA family transporter [Rubricoccus marinus]